MDSTIEKLEAVRIECGISIAELARRINVDRKRLWYVLNGQREMRVDEFLKLCVVFRIDPCCFVTRDMIAEMLLDQKGEVSAPAARRGTAS